MAESTANNKRIVKNTLIMYGRMLVSLIISLFTARIVFNTLGVDNYGIYNLVGGIIVFFTFLNNGLASATRRYITAEIGKGTEESTRHVFNVCIYAHILIALLILLLAETIGLWGVNYILNIPPDRMFAANMVYQFSVIAAVLGIMQSPFGCLIVAYEKMGIYAYFTILDIVFKLLIIFLVQYIPGDKLIVYAILVFVVSLIDLLINRIYCIRTFPVSKWQRTSDKPLLKEIFGFMSWSIMGQAAVVATNQGVSVLINIYYSVVANAAMGVSNAITGIVNGFVSNFQVAFNPQIIKSYASKELDYLKTLIYRSSKMSSYLVILFLTPLLFECDHVLTLWLGEYPQYALEFALLTLFYIYLEAVSAPLWMLVYSQSNIRQYQIVISLVYSLNFVLGWVALACGLPPYSVISVRIGVFSVLLLIRLYYAHKLLNSINIVQWLWQVVGKSVIIVALSCFCVQGFVYVFSFPLFMQIALVTLISLGCQLPLIYLIGFNASEKKFIKAIIINKIRLR